MNDDVILCPACQTENDPLSKTCIHCGQSLIRVCPRCNTVNAITAEQCFACQQHFDTLGQVMAREEVRTGDRFTRQADLAGGVKQDEKQQAQARSQQLWEVERQRQDQLTNQLVRRKEQERKMMIIAAIAAVIVIGILLISALAH